MSLKRSPSPATGKKSTSNLSRRSWLRRSLLVVAGVVLLPARALSRLTRAGDPRTRALPAEMKPVFQPESSNIPPAANCKCGCGCICQCPIGDPVSSTASQSNSGGEPGSAAVFNTGRTYGGCNCACSCVPVDQHVTQNLESGSFVLANYL